MSSSAVFWRSNIYGVVGLFFFIHGTSHKHNTHVHVCTCHPIQVTETYVHSSPQSQVISKTATYGVTHRKRLEEGHPLLFQQLQTVVPREAPHVREVGRGQKHVSGERRLVFPKLLHRLCPADLFRLESSHQPVGEGDGQGGGLSLPLALELGRRRLLKLPSQLCKVVVQLLQGTEHGRANTESR